VATKKPIYFLVDQNELAGNFAKVLGSSLRESRQSYIYSAKKDPIAFQWNIGMKLV